MAVVTLKGYDRVTVQPWLERVLVAMALFGLGTTCLRVYSRHLNRQSLWWDDCLAIFGMARIPTQPGLCDVNDDSQYENTKYPTEC